MAPLTANTAPWELHLLHFDGGSLAFWTIGQRQTVVDVEVGQF